MGKLLVKYGRLIFGSCPDSVARKCFSSFFKLLKGRRKREERQYIQLTETPVISVCIHSNASHRLIAVIAWQFQVDSAGLTCPDYEMGRISVGSQDSANRNQDDTYCVRSAACVCLHVCCRQVAVHGNTRPGPLSHSIVIATTTHSTEREIFSVECLWPFDATRWSPTSSRG